MTLITAVLAILLGILCVMQPFIIIKAVKFGIKCAEKPEVAAEEPFFAPKSAEERAETEEERRFAILRANIDNYVGDSSNQQEII